MKARPTTICAFVATSCGSSPALKKIRPPSASSSPSNPPRVPLRPRQERFRQGTTRQGTTSVVPQRTSLIYVIPGSTLSACPESAILFAMANPPARNRGISQTALTSTCNAGLQVALCQLRHGTTSVVQQDDNTIHGVAFADTAQVEFEPRHQEAHCPRAGSTTTRCQPTLARALVTGCSAAGCDPRRERLEPHLHRTGV